MKKRFLFLIALLAFPFIFAKAATEPKVLTLNATISGSTINYNGTMEDGSTAVMCKLYDTSDTELDLLSSPVDENEFSGTFNVAANGTYKIRCANYEGGEVKEVTVGAKNSSNSSSESSSKTTVSNPKTYDAGIKNSMIMFVISLFGMLGSSLYLKRKESK